MVKLKASRIQGNEQQVIAQLSSAAAGNMGVDADGWLWLCNVKIGRVKMKDGKPVKNEDGEMSLETLP